LLATAPAEGEGEAAPLTNPDPAPPRGRSLPAAFATAIVLLGLMLGFYLLGRRAFFVLVCVVVLLALFELLDSVSARGHRPNIPFGLLCGLALLAVAYAKEPQFLAVVLAAAVIGGFLLALLPKRGPMPATDVAWLVLGVGWLGGGGAGAVSILVLEPGGLELLVSVVVMIALDDIAAYFVGTRLGRHKIAPSISPNKSWEGFIAGVGGALVGGVVFGAVLDELTIGDGIALAAICSVLGPAGDLVESLVKREIGVKDSGRLLPGHGGFLDRLDAILFCAPAIYLYLRFVVF
jgi:phosphatidate cytidylyltransferase